MRGSRLRTAVPFWLAAVCLIFGQLVIAADDLSSEPIADGLPPAEAAKAMTVPEGFRVKLAAGEPMVHQPIAFAMDASGRLWVAEAYTYPNRAPDGKGRDKIIILEDYTGDGVFDSRKVFCEGLNLVSGLEVGFGGVWVGAAPYLLFIPDGNGDDVPDAPAKDWKAADVQFPKDVPPGATVLLDGFGWQDTHETLNSFIWGPDGWLYGCHGVFTHSRVGKPGTPDDQRTPMNAAVWRYHPVKQLFEVFAWGTSNPWGVDFNAEGQAFITACVIPHLFHIIPGGRYERQAGQHFDKHAYDDLKTIADHRHYVGNIRDHAWWGHEPKAPTDTLKAGGGHAHAGAMIYLGDNWPEEYRNKIYMNNIHGNRVNCDILERHGSGYVGHHGKDLLIANDRWYRGINLKTAPDGSVYLIDWYDKNACHRTNPEIWDRTNGRIYNIAYVKDGEPIQKKFNYNIAQNQFLASMLRHENSWQARMAQRALQERASQEHPFPASMLDALHSQARAIDEKVETNLRALWTLHSMGQLDSDELKEFIRSSKAPLRGWAVRLEVEDRKLGKSADDHAEWLRLLNSLAKDPSPAVRLEVAAALQRLPLSDRWDVAEVLLSHAEDAEDHNLPLMNWYAIEPLVAEDAPRAMALAKSAKIPLVARYIIRRAASDNKLLPHAVALINETDNSDTQLLVVGEMLAAFEGRVNIPMPESWQAAYDKLTKSQNKTLREKADQVAVALGDKRIFPRMRERLTDESTPMKDRKQALDILVRGRDEKSVDALQAVLDQSELRGPAIRALAGFDDPETPAAILKHYKAFNAEAKSDAVGTLTGRPQFAFALLAAIENGTVPRTDLHAFHIRQLLRFENPQLEDKIRKVWGEFRETSAEKQQQIAALKSRLTAERLARGDASHGRMLFAKTCANCHTLFGEGGKVGPDITGSNRTNLDYLLGNIVDPSAVLGKDYRMTVLALSDGRVVSGLIQKETDSALTVRTLNDTVVIPLDEIEDRKLSELSMMPEKLLDQLNPAEVRDLVAYLQSPQQVPLKGPAAPIDPGTGRVPGALEGETLKTLEKTRGTAASQTMGQFSADRWSGKAHLWWTGAKPGDRLELEVPVKAAGVYTLEIVLTRARDYGIVQLSLDEQKLGEPIDLFNSPEVVTTGVLAFENQNLTAGTHRLKIEILGANPKAVKSYIVGVDYVRLVPAEQK